MGERKRTGSALAAAVVLSVSAALAGGCSAAADGEPSDSSASGLATSTPKLVSKTCTGKNSAERAQCYVCKTICKGEARPTFCDDTGFTPPVDTCLKSTDVTYANAPLSKLPAYRYYALIPAPDNRSEEEFLRPTPLLPYMRHLRNLAAGDPTTWRATLDNQLAYAWSLTRSFPASGTEPASRAWLSYFVKGTSVREYAHGISESGWAEYLSSAASGETDDARRSDFLAKALLVDGALERGYESRNGGVRRDAGTCGVAGLSGDCWYFHSRGPENAFVAGTALNQSLHVLVDAIGELQILSTWTAAWPADLGITREDWIARLRKRIENGLTQWTYGVSGAPGQAPNLQESRWKLATPAAKPFFWSWYEYDLDAGTGGNDVTDQHVCHYHTITLQNLARIIRDLDPGRVGDGTNVSQYLGASKGRIVQARKQLVSYTHKGGTVDAVGADDSPAPYQWFRSEIDPSIRDQSSLACSRFPTEHALNDTDNDSLKSYLCGIYASAHIPQCTTP